MAQPSSTSLERRRGPKGFSPQDTIAAIDERIINADDPREIVLWTEVRREILKQDEYAERPRYKRKMGLIQVLFKMGFSLVSFATGIVLFIYGFVYLPALLIGAGLYAIAPDFVKTWLTGSQNQGVPPDE